MDKLLYMILSTKSLIKIIFQPICIFSITLTVAIALKSNLFFYQKLKEISPRKRIMKSTQKKDHKLCIKSLLN